MKLLKSILFLGLLGMIPNILSAQVKIGGNPKVFKNGDSSAILILEDTTRGFLVPRMTLNQRNTLKQPATGLSIFVTNNDTKGFYVNYGTPTTPNWVKLSNSSKDTLLMSQIDTIINKILQTDSIFSNSARIDTIYNKISRVDTLFAKTAHFDTVTIGKLKIRISGNLNDSIVVVNPNNDSLKRISPTRLISNTAFIQQGNTFGSTAILGTRDANDLKIITNGDTLMTFKYANKSIGIGKNSPAYNLEIGGNMRCDTIYTKYVKMSADNSFSTFAISTTGGMMVVSDKKFKDNIKPYTENVLHSIAKIPMVSYDWKNKNISPRHANIGVIAQDIQKIFPDIVETDKAGNLSLMFNNFTYYLMKAVQELNTKTIVQEQELSTIKQKIKNVEDKNQTLQQQIDKLQSMVESLIKK